MQSDSWAGRKLAFQPAAVDFGLFWVFGLPTFVWSWFAPTSVRGSFGAQKTRPERARLRAATPTTIRRWADKKSRTPHPRRIFTAGTMLRFV